MAYHTANDPAHKPPQEIDLDDGVYLPTSFVNENSGQTPLFASAAYFNSVEELLGPLCAKNGWELVHKDSCVRIKKVTSHAHIDLPLYAIPDSEFTTLAKALRAANGQQVGANEDVLFENTLYRELPADHIMLAHRERGWIKSDPRKIEDWFDKAIESHRDMIRSVSRYLKAWRDYQWEECSLTSLTIMTAVVDIFDNFKGDLPVDRDDIALLFVAEHLPEVFAREINNPVLPEQTLNGDWSPTEKHTYVAAATELRDKLRRALQDTGNAEVALRHIRDVFGARIPADSTLLRPETEEQTIRAYAPAVTAAPRVGRTRSG